MISSPPVLKQDLDSQGKVAQFQIPFWDQITDFFQKTSPQSMASPYAYRASLLASKKATGSDGSQLVLTFTEKQTPRNQPPYAVEKGADGKPSILYQNGERQSFQQFLRMLLNANDPFDSKTGQLIPHGSKIRIVLPYADFLTNQELHAILKETKKIDTLYLVDSYGLNDGREFKN
jgi:hypothetical protein